MAGSRPIKFAYDTFEPAEGCNKNLAPVIFLHDATHSKEAWGDIPDIISERSKRKAYAYDARNHGETEDFEPYNSDLNSEDFCKHMDELKVDRAVFVSHSEGDARPKKKVKRGYSAYKKTSVCDAKIPGEIDSSEKNFDQNVDDLFKFMDGLEIEHAVLVGHGMGGVTVTRAAMKQPHRFEIIFSEDMYVKQIPVQILDAFIRHITEWTEIVRSLPKHLEERDAFNQAVDALFEKNKESEMFTSKEALKKSNLRLKKKTDGGYDINFDKDRMIQACQNPETWMSNPSGKFNGPTYFIYGENSPFAVASEKSHIKKHFPRAELIEIRGASHNIHPEFHDKFLETIFSLILLGSLFFTLRDFDL